MLKFVKYCLTKPKTNSLRLTQRMNLIKYVYRNSLSCLLLYEKINKFGLKYTEIWSFFMYHSDIHSFYILSILRLLPQI